MDAIYKGTQGPTLDGSVYRSDGFLEQYGSYLAAAQDAHRAQSQIRAIMPRFDPHPVHAMNGHYGMPAARDPYAPPVNPADPYGPASGGFVPNGGPPPPPPPRP